MKWMSKGFTLLELLVVIIIIGILATIGFVQYTTSIEKGRQTEARTNLATLRQLQAAYFNDPQGGGGQFGSVTSLGAGLPDGKCDGDHFYSYACVNGAGPAGVGSAGAGACNATRCIKGQSGKQPDGANAYVITLDQMGGLSCSGTGC